MKNKIENEINLYLERICKLTSQAKEEIIFFKACYVKHGNSFKKKLFNTV